MLFKKRKIGLALGGGGVRSLSSIGVLRRLQYNNIKIKYIAGTSMGSVVGGLYSYYQDIDKVEEKIRMCLNTSEYKKLSGEFADKLKSISKTSKKKHNFKNKFYKYFTQIYLINKFLRSISLIKKEYVEPVVNLLIPDIAIENLPVKFCVVCTDIFEGKCVVIKKGSLRKAIMGSTAVQGVMPPEKWGSNLLIDGGGVRMTPVEEVRELGANFIIAVEVMTRMRQKEIFENGMEVIERSSRTTARELHKMILDKADIVISPAVKNIHWSNFKKIDYCINAGECAAVDILKF